MAFETIRAAVEAFTQDPDPTDAPYQRTLSERRADALDDLAMFGLTHHPDRDDIDPEDEAARADDTFDGSYPGDSLDEALLPENDGLTRSTSCGHDSPRPNCTAAAGHGDSVRARSGVCVNVHIDLRTLAGTRHLTDLDDLVLRGDGWSMARSAAEQFLCDSRSSPPCSPARAGSSTPTTPPSSSRSDNAAPSPPAITTACSLAAADHPGTATPTTSRTHDGGPTTIANACTLCRFHHRLLHQHRWTLRHDDGTWVATDPHGTKWKGRPTDQTV